MNILAIETCGPTISVALLYKDKVFEYTLSAGFKHAQLLLPGIDTLFRSTQVAKNELDLVTCTAGPGSFTGLRIGLATARGISLAQDIPLVMLSSLLVYTQGFLDQNVLAVLDAKKERFYVALGYCNKLTSTEYDVNSSEILELLKETSAPVLLTGPGAEILYEHLSTRGNTILDPHALRPRASMMLKLAEEHWRLKGDCDDMAGPFYLRESDVKEAKIPYSS